MSVTRTSETNENNELGHIGDKKEKYVASSGTNKKSIN